MSKYRVLFIEESREHLSELSRLLVAVETSDEPKPIIDEIFRHAHSLKGMAGSMGYDPIMYPEFRAGFFLGTVLMVILTGILSSLYPARKALGINPALAVKNE